MDNNDKKLDGVEVTVDVGAPSDTPPTDDPSAPRTALEFEIADGGLVFDEETTPPEPERTPEVVVEHSEPNPVVTAEEFSLPESFEVDERYDTPTFTEETETVHRTYVPRFTEVSETYRMKNDPRPRPATEKRRENIATAEETPLTPEPKVDPTAEECGEGRVERVEVKSSPIQDDEPKDESITLYKFDSPEDDDGAADEPAPAPIPEPEDESVIIVEQSAPEEEIVVPIPEPAPEDKGEYVMPDPECDRSVIDYSDMADTDSPTENSDSDNRKGEFTSPIQRDSFKDKFLDSLMSIRVRLIFAIIVFMGLASDDIFSLFGVNVLSSLGLDRVGSATAVIDFAFSACMLLLAAPELIRVFTFLFKGKVLPDIHLVVSIAVLAVYTAVVLHTGAISYISFGILFGIQAIASILGSYFRVKGDFRGFRVITKNTVKNVLDKRLTRELPRENMALDGAVDEYNSKTARVFRTVFVSDFFKHTSMAAESSANTLMVTGCGLGIAAVSAVVSYFLFDNSLIYAMQTFTAVYMLAMPTFSILSHKLPYSDATAEAEGENSAFIGENAFYEGADIDVIAYDDTEIFGIEDVSIKKVHLYGKAFNATKAMKEMYSLFSVVGGPLNEVFTASLDRKCQSATDIVIESDGISGIFEGHTVCAGTEAYMLRHGITVPHDGYRSGSLDSTRIMYGSEDGEVYVKFFIRYSFSEEFTMLLPYLKEEGIVPLIYTRDPNINLELVRVLTMGEDVIRVMRKDAPVSAAKTYRSISSPIATLGDKSNAIGMVLLAKRYTAFQSSLAVTELISMIVGAALAAVLAIGGMLNTHASGLVLGLALWQLAWCGVLLIRSKITFKSEKSK